MSNEWLQSLPEELREAPYLAKADSPKQALEHLIHAAQIQGRSIRIPDDRATPEDWTAFYDKLAPVPGLARLPGDDDMEGTAKLLAKLGAPAEAKDYPAPEIADFEWDDDLLTDLRTFAQQAGMTKLQFKHFATKLGEKALADGLSADQQLQTAQQALKQEWGAAFDERSAAIASWMEKSGAPEGMRNLFKEGNLPSETMNWLHSVAKQFVDKGVTIPKGEQGHGVLTPVEAREAIQRLLRDPAYRNPADPRQPDLVKRMVELHRLANVA